MVKKAKTIDAKAQRRKGKIYQLLCVSASLRFKERKPKW